MESSWQLDVTFFPVAVVGARVAAAFREPRGFWKNPRVEVGRNFETFTTQHRVK